MLCMSMLTSNSSGNMQKHGYLGCFHAASARENISWVWVPRSIPSSHKHTEYWLSSVWIFDDNQISPWQHWNLSNLTTDNSLQNSNQYHDLIILAAIPALSYSIWMIDVILSADHLFYTHNNVMAIDHRAIKIISIIMILHHTQRETIKLNVIQFRLYHRVYDWCVKTQCGVVTQYGVMDRCQH